MRVAGSKVVLSAAILGSILVGCGGGGSSSTSSGGGTPRPPAHDGPSARHAISESAIGNEDLEQGELQAIIKQALEEGSGSYHWEVNCDEVPEPGQFICTYFSREKVLEEVAEGLPNMVVQSEWTVNQQTGHITEYNEHEVEGSHY